MSSSAKDLESNNNIVNVLLLCGHVRHILHNSTASSYLCISYTINERPWSLERNSGCKTSTLKQERLALVKLERFLPRESICGTLYVLHSWLKVSTLFYNCEYQLVLDNSEQWKLIWTQISTKTKPPSWKAWKQGLWCKNWAAWHHFGTDVHSKLVRMLTMHLWHWQKGQKKNYNNYIVIKILYIFADMPNVSFTLKDFALKITRFMLSLIIFLRIREEELLEVDWMMKERVLRG